MENVYLNAPCIQMDRKFEDCGSSRKGGFQVVPLSHQVSLSFTIRNIYIFVFKCYGFGDAKTFV